MSRPGAPRGFSLLELMVALALVGLLITMMAPRMGATLAVIRSRSAIDRLSGDLAHSRMQAIRQGRTASVRITSSQKYVVTLDDGSTAIDTLKKVDLSGDYTGVALTPTSGRIAFDSRGLLRSGSLDSVVVRRSGRKSTLRISGVGRIYRDQ
ncbi:MAG TPA: GspH/FimT family pseudopilin [Longimicrobiaceae bacterium]|nr:GspH/FimT family pseudopilin [Longimicrobiaceae bacterium]